ncbi:MAG: hypothetical protein Q8M19_02440 [Reyranella sp.]|nr:hypothetical protein [Reyranella sp.]
MTTMVNFRRTLSLFCAVGLLGAAPALAQDEVQNFNAFAVVAANGTIVRAAEKQLMVVGTLSGAFFVETDEGPIHSGRVTCAASVRVDQATFRQTGTGACTFAAQDGATAWGDWECAGYELIGCRGTFKLNGGTARLAGATGEGTMIWRPSAHELRKQLDGATLDNATGILLWRDFKLKGK